MADVCISDEATRPDSSLPKTLRERTNLIFPDQPPTFLSQSPKDGRIEIRERVVVAQVGVYAPRHHASRFSYVVRGGTVIGLLAAASGGIVFQVAGLPYSPIAQAVIAALGVLTGAMFGAREPV